MKSQNKVKSLLSILAAVLVVAIAAPASAGQVILKPDGETLVNLGISFVPALVPPALRYHWGVNTLDDGDTSYVKSIANIWNDDLYTLEDPASWIGTINSVTVCIKAKAEASGATQAGARTVISDGTNLVYGAPITLGDSYVGYSTPYMSKPFPGGGAWTWTDISPLQAGVSLQRSKLPPGAIESRCTLVYVVVDYTPSELVCETAFAFGGDNATCFSEYGFSRWGWTNGPLAEGNYAFDLYAAAGRCDLSKGTLVGTLNVEYAGGTVTVTYNMNGSFTLAEAHLYVGNDILPRNNKGDYTVAPGQYPYSGDGSAPFVVSGLSGDIYVVAHAIVCGEFPEE